MKEFENGGRRDQSARRIGGDDDHPFMYFLSRFTPFVLCASQLSSLQIRAEIYKVAHTREQWTN